MIKVGKGGGSKGVHGHATILSKDDKILASAGGGGGGGTGGEAAGGAAGGFERAVSLYAGAGGTIK